MKIQEHLIAKTNPKANDKNILLWKDYRITVLQKELIRLEKNARGKFRDEATQSVWFRNFGRIEFQVWEEGESLFVRTQSRTFIIREKISQCAVSFDGEEIPLSNEGNLKGTYRTLDQCDGRYWHDFIKKKRRIRLQNGVCSRTGVAFFDDAQSLTLGMDGQIKPQKGVGKDYYVFAYGKEYRAAVQALYLLTGTVPLVPRYALGNWWSRYYPYSDSEYLKLLTRFEEHDVPLTVAAVDMDWHYSNHVDEEKRISELGRNTEYYGGNSGWTGYSWNAKLFPEPKAFLSSLKEKQLKVVLNIHPADGVRWWEDCYADMAKAMGLPVESLKQIPFDIANPRFINSYFSVLHHPNEEKGVDFWWIDWQQGKNSAIEGLDPLWALNHYHYLDNRASNKGDALILSRYAGIGSHRYPLGFSGDTVISWATLRYLIYFTQTASNVGYVWWSHDIGGHMLGTTTNELYLRSVQFGVLSPVNRFHCSDMFTITKEPWAYGNGCGKIAEEWLRFRHKLIPFLYSRDYVTASEGVPLVEPMYYRFGDCEESYQAKEQYVLGDTFLVAPVVTPLRKDGYAYTRVWLPKGRWTDFFTEDEYEAPKGGKYFTMLRRLESIPLLVRDGAIIPISLDKGNGVCNPQRLGVYVYCGDGAFDLFEDAKKGAKKAFTRFRTTFTEGERCVQTLTIEGSGDGEVCPQNRLIRIIFKNIPDGEATVEEDGVEIPVQKELADCLTVTLGYRAEKSYAIKVSFSRDNEVQAFIKRALKLLTESEDCNANKYWRCYCELSQSKTIREAVEIIQKSPIRACNKTRILEIL